MNFVRFFLSFFVLNFVMDIVVCVSARQLNLRQSQQRPMKSLPKQKKQPLTEVLYQLHIGFAPSLERRRFSKTMFTENQFISVQFGTILIH